MPSTGVYGHSSPGPVLLLPLSEGLSVAVPLSVVVSFVVASLELDGVEDIEVLGSLEGPAVGVPLEESVAVPVPPPPPSSPGHAVKPNARKGTKRNAFMARDPSTGSLRRRGAIVGAMRHVVTFLCIGALLGCDTTEAAVDKGKAVAEKAVEGTKDAVDASKKAVDASKKAIDTSKKTVEDVRKLWADVPSTGELSDTANRWVDEQGGSMGKVIKTGKQVAPVALEIGKTLSSAVESDRVIEPIFQEIEEGKTSEVDAAIAEMPRTEVIDGLTVGFKQLDEKSTDRMVTERGYLVTWRQDDHLIGFVYRSKETIDIEKLVAETPRLVALTKGVIAEQEP
jgi:hypothetical protein